MGSDRPYATRWGFYIGDRVETHTDGEIAKKGWIIGINDDHAVVQLDHGMGIFKFPDERLTRIES